MRYNAIEAICQWEIGNDERGDSRFRSEFGIAEKFHANFYHLFMEDYELDRDPAVVRDFVNRVLALLI